MSSMREIMMARRQREKERAAQHEEAKANHGTQRHIFLQQDLAVLSAQRLAALKATLEFPLGTDYDNMPHMKLTLRPDEGIWKGGVFEFQIDVPQEYKNVPPKVKCKTKHLHPNIDKNGAVCLNILRDDWRPVLTLEDVIVGLLYLYTSPNPDDPLDLEAAALMRKDYDRFVREARASCGLH